MWGNLWLALARFGGEDAFRGLVRDGIPQHRRTGPILADAAYPDVLVARAVRDGHDLDLILRPGNGKTAPRSRSNDSDQATPTTPAEPATPL